MTRRINRGVRRYKEGRSVIHDISSDPDRWEVHTELNDTLTNTMTKQLKPRNYSLFRGNLRRCPVAHRHTRQIKGKHSKSLIGLLA